MAEALQKNDGQEFDYGHNPVDFAAEVGEVIKIGRSELDNNNLLVANTGVSRKHLEIRIGIHPQTKEKIIFVKTLKENSTVLNNMVLKPNIEYQVWPGNRLILGDPANDVQSNAFLDVAIAPDGQKLRFLPAGSTLISRGQSLKSQLENVPQQPKAEAQPSSKETAPASKRELQDYILSCQSLSDLFSINQEKGVYKVSTHSKFDTLRDESGKALNEVPLQENRLSNFLQAIRKGGLNLSHLKDAASSVSLNKIAEVVATTLNSEKRPLQSPDFTLILPDNIPLAQQLNRLFVMQASKEGLYVPNTGEKLQQTRSFAVTERGQGYEEDRRGQNFDAVRANGSIAVVADGNGVETYSGVMARWVTDKLFPQLTPQSLGDFTSREQVQNNVYLKLEEIQRGMHIQFPQFPRGETGTTITAVVAGSEQAVIVHVGDSIGMKFSVGENGQAVTKRLTADHSDAEIRNALSRSFTPTSNVRAEVEVTLERVKPSDIIVLFSDGLEKYFALPIGKYALWQKGIREPADNASTQEKVAYEHKALEEGMSAAYPIIVEALKKGEDPAQAVLNAKIVPYFDNQGMGSWVSARQYADLKAAQSENNYHDDISLTVTEIGGASQLEVAQTQEQMKQKALRMFGEAQRLDVFRGLALESQKKLLGNVLGVESTRPELDLVIEALNKKYEARSSQTTFNAGFGGEEIRPNHPDYEQYSAYAEKFISAVFGDFKAITFFDLATFRKTVDGFRGYRITNKHNPSRFIDFGGISFVLDFVSASPQLWQAMNRESKLELFKVAGVTGMVDGKTENRNFRVALVDTIDTLLS